MKGGIMTQLLTGREIEWTKRLSKMNMPKIPKRTFRIGRLIIGILWIVVGAILFYFLTCPNVVKPEPGIAKEYKAYHIGSH